MQAMGDVDELISLISLLLAEDLPVDVRADLITSQHDLFNVRGHLSIPGFAVRKQERVAQVDTRLALNIRAGGDGDPHKNLQTEPPAATWQRDRAAGAA